GFDVGSRVHEYGGGAYLPAGRTLFACSRGDQRLYRIAGERSPVPITAGPPTPAGLRYADLRLVSSGTLLVCVRERHQGEGVVNELVAVPAEASADPWVVASGHDFYAAPAPAPRVAALRGSPGTGHACRGMAPTCGWPTLVRTGGSVRPDTSPAARKSPSCSPSGTQRASCILSRTGPAGGTSTAGAPARGT